MRSRIAGFIQVMILVVAICGLAGNAAAQDNGVRTMAPFEVTLVNNQSLKAFQIKKNQPAVIMYFSPDCDHCKDLTRELVKNIKRINTKPLYMITYYPLAEVKKFANDLSLQKYSNIRVGTEGMSLIVQKHYNIRKFPFLILFDKAGKFVRIFREQVPAEEIIAAIEKL